MTRMMTTLVEDTTLVIPVAVDVWQEWIDVHADEGEDGFALAEAYFYADADGAIICQCCGVNYSPAVDKD